MGALFSGKLPHAATLIPGGVTDTVTDLKITKYSPCWRNFQVSSTSRYLPDVIAVAGAFPEYFTLGQGCGNFMAYGAFPESAEGSARLLLRGS